MGLLDANADLEQAIALSQDPPLSLLDNRAACLVKTGDLKGALRDSRRMLADGKGVATVGTPAAPANERNSTGANGVWT